MLPDQLQTILTVFMDENPGYYVECVRISDPMEDTAIMRMRKGHCFSIWTMTEEDIRSINEEFSGQAVQMIDYMLINLKRMTDEEYERSGGLFPCQNPTA